ncbi:general transcription factor II-I repeat domain-containing protein 2A-like [Macrobrachium nipponense]|uniref:general transcription factor II-I repeat domain-containing protein 2A-like n=1 Tax=Macrobrachium nipponense TaxID=159736 RepID=UPI0030C8B2A3
MQGFHVQKNMFIQKNKEAQDVTEMFLKSLRISVLNRMTVQRRIVDLSGDIVDQLKEKSKQFVYFSLATDESTDVTSTAQLLVFVRGVTEDFSIHEELVGLSSLKGQTTGSDLLNGLLEQISVIELDLDKLVGISTDGAPAMIGKQNGLVQLLI